MVVTFVTIILTKASIVIVMGGGGLLLLLFLLKSPLGSGGDGAGGEPKFCVVLLNPTLCFLRPKV